MVLLTFYPFTRKWNAKEPAEIGAESALLPTHDSRVHSRVLSRPASSQAMVLTSKQTAMDTNTRQVNLIKHLLAQHLELYTESGVSCASLYTSIRKFLYEVIKTLVKHLSVRCWCYTDKNNKIQEQSIVSDIA